MSVQDLLVDVLSKCAISKIENLKITGTDDKVRIQGHDSDRTLFIDANSNIHYPEITGEFGLFNFKILNGLLGMANFRSETSKFSLGTRTIDNEQVPDCINFSGGGASAVFRLMNKEIIPEQASIVNIPWDITMVISPSKYAEYQQISSLYSDVDELFTIRTDNGNLIAEFGNDSSSTHFASMVLSENVNGTLTSEMKFLISHFITVMKIANKADNYEIKITSKGIMGITVATDIGVYNYYIKKSV